MTWTNDHGPDGLYDKFTVTQNSTGKQLGEDGEFVFVLRPESDRSAWIALRIYAINVRKRSPQLADQMCERLDEIARPDAPTP